MPLETVYLMQFCTSFHVGVRHNFTNRIVSVWNSLPNNVVTANTINTFKNRLDKFWEHQGVLYNYRANITGIGNCSTVVD